MVENNGKNSIEAWPGGMRVAIKSMLRKIFHEFGYRKMNMLLKNDGLDTVEAKNGTSFAC